MTTKTKQQLATGLRMHTYVVNLGREFGAVLLCGDGDPRVFMSGGKVRMENWARRVAARQQAPELARVRYVESPLPAYVLDRGERVECEPPKQVWTWVSV